MSAGPTPDLKDTATWIHMPLAKSYLCEDCHEVGNIATQCPGCASKAIMSLAAVLGREEENEL